MTHDACQVICCTTMNRPYRTRVRAETDGGDNREENAGASDDRGDDNGDDGNVSEESFVDSGSSSSSGSASSGHSLSSSGDESEIVDYTGGDPSGRDQETFEGLCTLLAQNNPGATVVCRDEYQNGLLRRWKSDDYASLRFPWGYGAALGLAIQGNTHVSSIHIDLSTFLPDGNHDIQEAALLLSFIQDSEKLQEMELHYWIPEVFDGVSHDTDIELTGMFLEAIMENGRRFPTKAWSLCLFAPAPEDAFASLMETTTLQELDLNVGLLCPDESTLAADALGNNVSLKRLGLYVFSNTDKCLAPILSRLAKHSSLRKLSVTGQGSYKLSRNHTRALAGLIPLTVRLQQLDLTFPTMKRSHIDCLQRALLQNGSLHKMSLCSPTEEDSVLSEDIARRIEAVCQRNRLLPIMISKPWRVTTIPTETTPTPTTNTTIDEKTNPQLFTHLLGTAGCNIPHSTGPNSVLQGLLAASDALSRRQRQLLSAVDRKRKCDDDR